MHHPLYIRFLDEVLILRVDPTIANFGSACVNQYSIFRQLQDEPYTLKSTLQYDFLSQVELGGKEASHDFLWRGYNLFQSKFYLYVKCVPVTRVDAPAACRDRRRSPDIKSKKGKGKGKVIPKQAYVALRGPGG
jgi:hypothetical protein